MFKLNNKGFAISTILFSILILGTLVFGTLYTTTISTKDCKNNCCEPPCNIPKKEKVNEDPCTGEFMIGSEHFCVLKSTSSKVTALAKYNLNLGCKEGDEGCSYPRFIAGEAEGMQTPKTKNLDSNGTVAALSDSDITTGSNKYGYYKIINSDTTELQHLDNLTGSGNNSRTVKINKYVNDYKEKLKNISNTNNLGISNEIVVRLLNYEDLTDTNNFNCKDGYNKSFSYYSNIDNINYSNNNSYGNNMWHCSTNNSNKWLFWTNYWTGVVNYSAQVPLYNITINGDYINKDSSGENDDINGVRPVIEITKNAYDRMPKS